MMIKGAWEPYPPTTQLILLGAVTMISAFIFIFIGSILDSVFFGINIFSDPNMLTQLDDPQVLGALKLLQIFQHLGMFVIAPLAFAFIASQSVADYLGLNRFTSLSSLFMTGMIMIASMPLINWMVSVNEMLHLPEFMAGIERWMKESEESAARFTEAFMVINGPTDLMVNILMIALIPAIGEELLFRGVIQRLFIKWTDNVHWGILIASILFSAMHLQFYGFLPRMMMGVLFGYLFLWSGSIWLPILCHFINNGTAVLVIYLSDNGVINPNTENIGSGGEDSLITIFCAILVAGLLFLIYKKEKAPKVIAPS